MTPTTRADLAKLVPDGGTMIELGVAAGRFAVELMAANTAARYIGIDRWNDHHDEAEFQAASARVGHDRLIRSTFADARPSFAPASVDLVYIDGYAHTGQDGGKTLDDWWPVVKPGGIFAGHDYDTHHYRETVAVVDEFVRRTGLALNIIDESPHPSWWVRKPGATP